MQKILYVDMDGVMCGFDEGLLWYLEHFYPRVPRIELKDRTTFRPADQYPKEYASAIKNIVEYPGFFATLPPIKGAIEAVKHLNENHSKNVKLFFCTTPIAKFDHCIEEKYLWIAKHLGREYAKKIIIIDDKTLVLRKNTYLIDDRSTIKGWVENPEGEHVVYDRPYNRESVRRRMTWDNWDWLIKELIA